ncbi:hypothetical protein OG625_27355 [Streptomyces sp. NBC_01351]|uniref:hypothetical protein n=1 Tax=Streptomyces sp. NBC_01351 TaxID=2903833 RepID=UPI002E2EA7C1|nr:hypothetical protein [Streptomyces sp. NBC_01351]
MSTPPNPPSTPTEPAGTPIPEGASVPASIPAPAPPSLEKTPAQAPAPSLEKIQTPSPVPVPARAPEDAPAAPAASPFAPLTPPAPVPAHPTAPGFGGPTAPGFGAPAAPGNPWVQLPPGAGYTGYAPPSPASNGLAVAAAVVGGIGILIGLIPFFFWLGGILALTAIGLGIGAIVRSSKGAPNKALSVVGTVLGGLALIASVGGMFLTAVVADEAADGIEQRRKERLFGGATPSPSKTPWSPPKSPSPSQVPGLTSALPFGETFTYPNGVQVSLSVPKEYKPKGTLAREKVENAIQITVTITNGSTVPYEVIHAVPNVRDDKGMTASMVFDVAGPGGGVPRFIRGAIMPGESASGIVAFEVPEGTKSIRADISPGVSLDDVKYAGPVG